METTSLPHRNGDEQVWAERLRRDDRQDAHQAIEPYSLGCKALTSSGKRQQSRERSHSSVRTPNCPQRYEMREENLARLNAHRNNMHRYRRLLKTRLSDLERDFILRRLEQEEDSFNKLSATTYFLPLGREASMGSESHV
jgi:hypothetical protein